MYVRHWVGGEDPWVLREVAEFLKSLKVANEIPGLVLGKLARLNLGPLVGICWRQGCVKAIAMVPATKYDDRGGVIKYLLGYRC